MIRTNIAILASGSGSTAEAFIHATQNGVINAQVVIVIVNNKHAGVIDRVRRMNAQYELNIKIAHVSGVTHPGGIGEKGEQTLEESAEICRLVSEQSVNLIVLMGYMKKIRGELLKEYGAQPSHTSVYQARMLNTHPGPLPATGSQFGIHVQQVVLEQGIGYSAQNLHVVSDGYDMGAVIAEHKVPVIVGDTPESLFDSVQLTEKSYLPVDIDRFLREQAEYMSTL